MIFPMFEGVMFISAPGSLDNLDNLDNLDSSTMAFFWGVCGGAEYHTKIWVCLKIGYIPNYSHLIGIMIINHWV